jgi:hypothetical protein
VNVDVRFDRTNQRISGVWNPNDAERQAAWELCVELCTRVPVVPLRDHEGLLEEALTSLHNIFGQTREILRRNGPAVAEDRRGELSLAVLAGHMLNQVIRPITAYWHPEIQRLGAMNNEGLSKADTERQWPRAAELRTLLTELREPLTAFARVFAEACGAEEFLKTQLDNETRLYESFVRRAVQADPS